MRKCTGNIKMLVNNLREWIQESQRKRERAGERVQSPQGSSKSYLAVIVVIYYLQISLK